ncbi:rbcL [Symbiodinium sp. CCMP2592]|nr:rbcL [Symbiodinium sp. CCMP2592]
MGFVEIELATKVTRRHGSSWSFRAKRDDTLELVQGLYDGGDGTEEVQAMLESMRRGQTRKEHPLGSERRVSYSTAAPCDKRAEDLTEDTWKDCFDCEQVDEDAEADELGGMTDAPPGASLVVSSAEGAATGQELEATTAGTKRQGSEAAPKKAAVPRLHAPDTYLEYWVGQGRPTVQAKPQDDAASYEDFLAEAVMIGSYAGALELLTYCFSEKCRAWVGAPAGEVWNFNPTGADHNIFLWFIGKHYEYYKDAVESEWATRKRCQDEQGGLKPQPLRGSGAMRRPKQRAASPCKTAPARRVRVSLSDFASTASKTSGGPHCASADPMGREPALESEKEGSEPRPHRGGGPLGATLSSGLHGGGHKSASLRLSDFASEPSVHVNGPMLCSASDPGHFADPGLTVKDSNPDEQGPNSCSTAGPEQDQPHRIPDPKLHVFWPTPAEPRILRKDAGTEVSASTVLRPAIIAPRRRLLGKTRPWLSLSAVALPVDQPPNHGGTSMSQVAEAFDVTELPVPKDQQNQHRQDPRRGKSHYLIDGQCQAVCHLCPFRSVHASAAKANQAHVAHYKSAHPDDERPLAPRPKPIQLRDVSEEDPACITWQCRLCHLGTTEATSEGRLRYAARAHFGKSHPKAGRRKGPQGTMARTVVRKRLRASARTTSLNAGLSKRWHRDTDGWRIFSWPTFRRRKRRDTRLRFGVVTAWQCVKCMKTSRGCKPQQHQCKRIPEPRNEARLSVLQRDREEAIEMTRSSRLSEVVFVSNYQECEAQVVSSRGITVGTLNVAKLGTARLSSAIGLADGADVLCPQEVNVNAHSRAGFERVGRAAGYDVYWSDFDDELQAYRVCMLCRLPARHVSFFQQNNRSVSVIAEVSDSENRFIKFRQEVPPPPPVLDYDSVCEEVGDQLVRSFASETEVIVATDGSAHQLVAAFSIVFTDHEASVCSGLPSEDQTAFRAELEAIYMVIRAALRVWDRRFPTRRLVIVSDCQSAIDIVQGALGSVPILARRVHADISRIARALMWSCGGSHPMASSRIASIRRDAKPSSGPGMRTDRAAATEMRRKWHGFLRQSWFVQEKTDHDWEVAAVSGLQRPSQLYLDHAGYDYLATAAHFAAESSTGTNVNVCTTDDFTKSVDALVYYIDPDSEEMNGRLTRGGQRAEGLWNVTAADFHKAAQGRKGSAEGAICALLEPARWTGMSSGTGSVLFVIGVFLWGLEAESQLLPLGRLATSIAIACAPGFDAGMLQRHVGPNPAMIFRDRMEARTLVHGISDELFDNIFRGANDALSGGTMASGASWIATWRSRGLHAFLGDCGEEGVFRTSILARCPGRVIKLDVRDSSRYTAVCFEFQFASGIRKVIVVSVYSYFADKEAASAYVEEIVSCLRALGTDWMVLGDMNVTAEEGPMASRLAAGMARLLDDPFLADCPLPATAGGTRRIDYGLTADRLHPVGLTWRAATETQWSELFCENDFKQCLADRDVDAAWTMLSNVAERVLARGGPGDAGLPRSAGWQPRAQAQRSKACKSFEPVCLVRLRRLSRRLVQLRRRPGDARLRDIAARDIAALQERFPWLDRLDHFGMEELAQWVCDQTEEECKLERERGFTRWRASLSSSMKRQTEWIKRRAALKVGALCPRLQDVRDLRRVAIHPAVVVQRAESEWVPRWTAPTVPSEPVEAILQQLGSCQAQPATVEFTADKLRKCAKRMVGKASGPDDWEVEAMLALPTGFWSALASLWQCVYEKAVLPGRWREAKVALVPKPTGDHRPISILSVAYRVGASALVRELRPWAEGWLGHRILGGVQQRCARDVFIRLFEAAEDPAMIFIGQDVSKFFDSLCGSHVVQVLRHLQAPAALVELIGAIMSEQWRVFSAGGQLGANWFRVDRGAAQGDPLSPLLAAAVMYVWTEYVAASGAECAAGPTVATQLGYDFAEDLELLGVSVPLTTSGVPELARYNFEAAHARVQCINAVAQCMVQRSRHLRTLVVPMFVWAAAFATIPKAEISRLASAILAVTNYKHACDTPALAVWEVMGWHCHPGFARHWAALRGAMSLACRPPCWLEEASLTFAARKWPSLLPVAAEVLRELGWWADPEGAFICRRDRLGTLRRYAIGFDAEGLVRVAAGETEELAQGSALPGVPRGSLVLLQGHKQCYFAATDRTARNSAMATGCSVAKLGTPIDRLPSRPHLLWQCSNTATLRPGCAAPTNRAEERLLARVVPEMPASPGVVGRDMDIDSLAALLDGRFEAEGIAYVGSDGSSVMAVAAWSVAVHEAATVAGGVVGEDQSPYRAEVEALLSLFEALSLCRRRGTLVVVSDCQSALAAVQGKGNAVKLVARLCELHSLCCARGFLIHMFWIPSHGKIAPARWVVPMGGEALARHLNDRADVDFGILWSLFENVENLEDMWRILGKGTSNGGLVVGTIIQPKLGLQPKPFGEACYAFWQGGDFSYCDTTSTSVVVGSVLRLSAKVILFWMAMWMLCLGLQSFLTPYWAILLSICFGGEIAAWIYKMQYRARWWDPGPSLTHSGRRPRTHTGTSGKHELFRRDVARFQAALLLPPFAVLLACGWPDRRLLRQFESVAEVSSGTGESGSEPLAFPGSFVNVGSCADGMPQVSAARFLPRSSVSLVAQFLDKFEPRGALAQLLVLLILVLTALYVISNFVVESLLYSASFYGRRWMAAAMFLWRFRGLGVLFSYEVEAVTSFLSKHKAVAMVGKGPEVFWLAMGMKRGTRRAATLWLSVVFSMLLLSAMEVETLVHDCYKAGGGSVGAGGVLASDGNEVMEMESGGSFTPRRPHAPAQCDGGRVTGHRKLQGDGVDGAGGVLACDGNAVMDMESKDSSAPHGPHHAPSQCDGEQGSGLRPLQGGGLDGAGGVFATSAREEMEGGSMATLAASARRALQCIPPLRGGGRGKVSDDYDMRGDNALTGLLLQLLAAPQANLAQQVKAVLAKHQKQQKRRWGAHGSRPAPQPVPAKQSFYGSTAWRDKSAPWHSNHRDDWTPEPAASAPWPASGHENSESSSKRRWTKRRGAAEAPWTHHMWALRAEDWAAQGDAKLYVTNSLEVANLEEVAQACDMAASSKQACATIVLQGAALSQDQVTDLMESYGMVVAHTRIPGKLGSKLSIRSCNLFGFGADWPRLRTKNAPTVTLDTARESWVLRLSAHWKYNHTDWSKFRKQPGALARRWMQAVLPVASDNIGDSWHWQEGRDGLQGLVRIFDPDPATAVLQASGSSHVDSVFFADPVGAPPPGFDDLKVLWLPWNGDESWFERSFWTFRALRADGLELVQGAYEQGGIETEVQAVLEVRRRGPRTDKVSLAPERRTRGSGQTLYPSRDAGADPFESLNLFDMDLDEEGDLTVDDQTVQLCGAKRPAGPPEPSSARPASSRQKTEWTPTGRVVPNLGHGDCLFHAIAQGLTEFGERGSSGKPRSHRQLRAFVVGVYKKHRDQYRDLWINQGRVDPSGTEQPESATFEAYTNAIASALELNAYCEATATEAWVVSDGVVYHFNRHGKAKGLFFRHKDRHYELLVGAQRDQWVARKLQQDEEGGQKLPPLRGGGTSDCAASLRAPALLLRVRCA